VTRFKHHETTTCNCNWQLAAFCIAFSSIPLVRCGRHTKSRQIHQMHQIHTHTHTNYCSHMHTSRGHLLARLLARLCIWVNVVFVSRALQVGSLSPQPAPKSARIRGFRLHRSWISDGCGEGDARRNGINILTTRFKTGWWLVMNMGFLNPLGYITMACLPKTPFAASDAASGSLDCGNGHILSAAWKEMHCTLSRKICQRLPRFRLDWHCHKMPCHIRNICIFCICG